MGFIDYVLNLAGLLLWLNWRAERLDATMRAPVISLAGTLRKTGSSRIQRWKVPIALVALLLLRPLLYRELGSKFQYTFSLDLTPVTLPFRSDSLNWYLMPVYSLLSFGFALAFLYLALLLLSLVNGGTAEGDPVHRIVRLHLGRVASLPWVLKCLLPGAAGMLFWLVSCHAFAALGIVPTPRSIAELWQQGLLVGAGVYLQWRDVILAVLILHLINAYVYLGRLPVWTYVQLTAQNLLRPFAGLPLRADRIDFAPLVGIAVVCVLAQTLKGWRLAHWDGLLPWLYAQLPF